ncbi:MAG: hypothetical protein WB616_02000 [Candidatus Sulfotelmatobacter sp.]|jgi:hypothetical protein
MARSVFYRLVVSVLLVSLAVPALGADFWAKKPYQQWSKEETGRMLEESPWATTLSLGGVEDVLTGSNAPTTSSSQGHRGTSSSQGYGEMETNPTISYNLQFRSAEPIREAMVRSSELNSHYDAMSAEQKTAVDANAAKFLAVKFADRVVVSVTFKTNVQDYESQLRTYWGQRSLPTLSMSVFLDAGKERLSLMDYSFEEDTFQFVFPRPKKVSPDEKLGVEFIHPKIDRIGQRRILQEFSLKKMLVNGEPVF